MKEACHDSTLDQSASFWTILPSRSYPVTFSGYGSLDLRSWRIRKIWPQMNLHWVWSSGSANVHASKSFDAKLEASAEQIRGWGSCPVIIPNHYIDFRSLSMAYETTKLRHDEQSQPSNSTAHNGFEIDDRGPCTLPF